MRLTFMWILAFPFWLSSDMPHVADRYSPFSEAAHQMKYVCECAINSLSLSHARMHTCTHTQNMEEKYQWADQNKNGETAWKNACRTWSKDLEKVRNWDKWRQTVFAEMSFKDFECYRERGGERNSLTKVLSSHFDGALIWISLTCFKTHRSRF